MLKSGSEYLESLRDGRVVYVGSEKVTDVTTHMAFRNAARSFAAIYDMKCEPENRDAFSFEENGERYSLFGRPLSPSAAGIILRHPGRLVTARLEAIVRGLR